MSEAITQPAGPSQQPTNLPVIAPMVKDEATGAVYIHRDLKVVVSPFEAAEHVAPVKPVSVTERLGDIESWSEYVKRYGNPIMTRAAVELDEINHGADVGELTLQEAELAKEDLAAEVQDLVAAQETFLTWNTQGLKAVLDYHTDEAPGRCTWVASYQFEMTPQFREWSSFADGDGVSQRDAVEFIEDHYQDIVEPAQSELLTILRGLRANLTATADTRVNADGTASIDFHKSSSLTSSDAAMTLPGEITIQVPVIKGHVDEDGNKQIFKLVVRLRATVAEGARLELHFTMPQVEIVLDQVYEELVTMAKAALGDEYSILRAAG